MKLKNLVRHFMPGALCIAVHALTAAVPAQAQTEKRTVFAPGDFHWQGKLQPGAVARSDQHQWLN
jgi:hypothetical protein